MRCDIIEPGSEINEILESIDRLIGREKPNDRPEDRDALAREKVSSPIVAPIDGSGGGCCETRHGRELQNSQPLLEISPPTRERRGVA